MNIVRTIAELRAALGSRRDGTVGFVATMGALHDGHLSLVRAARDENDTVVLSIFVNPTQFNDVGDLDAYPRTEERDLELSESNGVDIAFVPDAAEMYPPGYATEIAVTGPVAETLEGAHRGRVHFDGVATVVVKLLMAVRPDVAYFGAKDAQQVVVVRRAVADLHLPVRIASCPTVRDDDGLALSSRNVRLTPDDRARALAIPRSLNAIAAAASGGERSAAALVDVGRAILADAGITPEYLAIVDPTTLEPMPSVDRPALVAIAAKVGDVRLIDNVLAEPGADDPNGCPGAG